MKKKTKISLITAAVLLAILVVPVSCRVYEDGGTRTYTALTYKIVHWQVLDADETYEKVRFYPFPYNFRSIDTLRKKEEQHIDHTFAATVRDIKGSCVWVEPLEGEYERQCSDSITFNTNQLENIGAAVGSIVEITYTGDIMETYPARVHATGWRLADEQA